MKRVGVIGGLGPLSTMHFYKKVIYLCQHKLNSEYPNMIINSVDTWRFVEAQKNSSEAIDFLVKEIKKIEDHVDFIVIPCNTAHFVINEVREAINVPILAINEEVIKAVKKYNPKKVGIIGTNLTITSGIYTNLLGEEEINYEILPSNLALELNQVTYNEMMGKSRITPKVYKIVKEELLKCINYFKEDGCDSVIVGCTDYPYFITQRMAKIKLFSSTDILAEAVIDNLKE